MAGWLDDEDERDMRLGGCKDKRSRKIAGLAGVGG